ncbi:MAG: hypothetical protein GY716_11525 [bacterium]|nr:hypothetical protein [bacterium]
MVDVARSRLIARTETDADGKLCVLSPAVGWWSDPPAGGSLVGGGSRIGELLQLTQRHELLLPEGVAGRVADGLPAHSRSAVEYGQTLFRLAPVDAAEGEAAAAPGHGQLDLPSGTYAVVAPTDGVFYRRSAPDQEPFVDVGDEVAEGQPIGLIEVMKTFNQIAYGGMGLPQRARVLEVRCADGTEVSAGDLLLIVK